ncbi:MAG: hypothetical protein EXS15_04025 [Phycisphaerales bacterium]|nr:hypothetical protein [Phycisphaerales bacterium]
MATTSDSPTPSQTFPETRTLWISEKLSEGEAGRALANGYVMTSYLRPLVVYCRALRLHDSIRTEPQDIVVGFFAHRLAKQEYLKDWLNSGLRLRQWLRNGLHLYVHEQRRENSKGGHGSDALHDVEATGQSQHHEFERAWALGALDMAMREAIAELDARGSRCDWELFWSHHVDGIPYAVLAERRNMTAPQAAQRAFAVAAKVRTALYGILRKDGALTSEIGLEVRAMMEVLHERGS